MWALTRGTALQTARRLVHVVRDDLMDLVLGDQCVGCQRPGRGWCRSCAGSLRSRSATPVRSLAPLPPVWAATAYTGTPRAALLAYKERGRAGLTRPLAAALSGSLGALLRSVPPKTEVLVVPVPTSRAAVRRRGYDPLFRMARVATRSTRRAGHPVRLIRALRLRRVVADQTALDATQRAANLAGAFEVPARCAGVVAGRAIVVVDDVVTTGATAAEAVRALETEGATVVGVATVAATVRSRAGPSTAADLRPGGSKRA